MKGKYLNKLIAASVITSTVFAISPVKVEAAWISNYYGGWAYSDGYSIVTGWKNISGTWYYFDSNGVMKTGWVNVGGLWYYFDRSGAMQTGVIQVEGKIYLLSQSGAMQTGPSVINKKMYNFGPDGAVMGSDVPVPQKAYDYYGNPVQPYVPSQISVPNVDMDTNIPLDIGEQPKTEYRVYYKDDDGEDLITKKVEGDFGKSFAYITLYEPEKSGYEFIEWNTKKNGNGTSYDAGDKIKLTEDLKLYAQWDEIDDDDDENIKVTSITIQQAGTTSTATPKVIVGEKLQLTKKISPSDATNTKVTWSVKNGINNTNGKATIDSNGLLTAVQAGTVSVKAMATDGSKVYKEINVIIED